MIEEEVLFATISIFGLKSSTVEVITPYSAVPTLSFCETLEAGVDGSVEDVASPDLVIVAGVNVEDVTAAPFVITT